MAQAGVAYCYTASIQPVQSRGSKKTSGSKYGGKSKSVPNTGNRKPDGRQSSPSPKSGRSSAGSGRYPSGTSTASNPNRSLHSGRRTAGNGGKNGGTKQGNGFAYAPTGKPLGKPVGAPIGKTSKKPAGMPNRAGAVSPARAKTEKKEVPPRRNLSPKRLSSEETRRLQAEKARRIHQIRIRENINRVMLGVTGFLIVTALFIYIGRMAEISKLSKRADSLKAEITDLKEQKQYKEVELAAAQDPARIRDTAIRRLGMIEPPPESIRYISLDGYLETTD